MAGCSNIKVKLLGLTTVRDLTFEKEKEKEIIEAKNRAEESEKVKIFVPGQYEPREYRTPMNGIVGFSEMYLTPGLSDEKRTEFANIVIDCSKAITIDRERYSGYIKNRNRNC